MAATVQDYLNAGEAHRAMALALISCYDNRSPYEWALVIAFYSAVHYANALILYATGVDAGSRKTRQRILPTLPAFQVQSRYGLTIFQHYLHLFDLSHQARYSLGFAAHRIDVDGTQSEDLETVRQAVYSALGQAPP